MFLSSHDDVQWVKDSGHWTLFQLAADRDDPAVVAECRPAPLEIVSVTDDRGSLERDLLVDGNPGTRWMTAGGQRAGDALVIDLGRPHAVCGVELSMGATGVWYPGTLSLAASVDGVTWRTLAVHRMGGGAFRAAIDDPGDIRVAIPVGGHEARYIQLRIEHSRPDHPWAVAELAVNRSRPRAAEPASKASK